MRAVIFRKGINEGGPSPIDIMLAPNGFIATGLMDEEAALAKNEGDLDILITHFDLEGEVLLHETVGSHKKERVGRSLVHPLKAVAIVVGHHEGYGIDESGNAYVAASFYEDISSLMSGSCEVPRVLQVEMLEGRDNISGDIISGILDLNTNSYENDLLDFAEDNNIQFLALFKLGFIFDALGNPNDKTAFRNKLADFIGRANNRGILCGYIADQSINAINNVSNYNISKHNYHNYQKLNFVMLEHEYWNAFNDDEFLFSRNQTQRPNLTTTPPPTVSVVDAFYDELHDDHIYLLDLLKIHQDNSANNWFVYDYIAKLYLDLTPPFTNQTTYTKSNTSSRQSKAQDLDGLSDVIFLAYYQYYLVNDGKDFLDINSTNGNVESWWQRLSYFGNNPQKRTNVIPLFSIEDNEHCGKNPFLGHILESAPYYGSENMVTVEDAYNSQHNGMFNSTSYPSLQHIALSGFGWFKYDRFDQDGNSIDCLVSKSFSNVNLLLCSAVNYPISVLNIKRCI